MYYLRVETDFAAAHFLTHYHGKCEKLHGHNYRVRLWVKSSELNEGGMAVDFSVLKKALKDTVECLDHSNLNDLEVFRNDPSAERISRYIYDAVKNKIPPAGTDAKIHAVDVFETPGSMARYTEDD